MPFTYTVVSPVTSIKIVAIGAGGGYGSGGVGGDGGTVTAEFIVGTGDIITGYIGNGGDYAGGTTTGAACITPPPPTDIIAARNTVTGRIGGLPSTNGGGGGSLTCVTLTKAGTAIPLFLLIAGGGGGGCGDSGNGGNGGSGVAGGVPSSFNGADADGNQGSGGITTATGGTGGTGGTNPATSGFIQDSLFTTGKGGDNSGSTYGGGGGGGYGGGGGGTNIPLGNGGGGGSSYINSSLAIISSNTTYNGTPKSSNTGDGKGSQSANATGDAGNVTIIPNEDPPPSENPCFNMGTRILMVDGYVPVEELQQGQLVLTAKGPTPIIEMVKFTSSAKTHPLYVLIKDTLSLGSPLQDLYMSHNHAFKHKGLWHHMKCSSLTKKVDLEDELQNQIVYYHIIVEDYFKYTIKAENVEVETCFKYKEDDIMMIWSCKKACCLPIKACRKIGEMRAEIIELPDTVIPHTVTSDTVIEYQGIDISKEVELSDKKIRIIEKLMDKPFDPLLDTYQIKHQQQKKRDVQPKKTGKETMQQKLEAFMSQTQQAPAPLRGGRRY